MVLAFLVVLSSLAGNGPVGKAEGPVLALPAPP